MHRGRTRRRKRRCVACCVRCAPDPAVPSGLAGSLGCRLACVSDRFVAAAQPSLNPFATLSGDRHETRRHVSAALVPFWLLPLFLPGAAPAASPESFSERG
jgi:hypothetical protein